MTKITFNIWKHHFQEIKTILQGYHKICISTSDLVFRLNKIGTNCFDVYMGNISVKKIIRIVRQRSYMWIQKKYNYWISQFPDNSLWVLKYKMNTSGEKVLHIHPARSRKISLESYQDIPIQIRFHANTYKTLLCTYWLMLEYNHSLYSHKEIFLLINEARNILHLPAFAIEHSKIVDIYKTIFL